MRRRRTLKRLNRRSAKKSPASGLPNSATHNFPAPADLASPHSPPANSTKLTHTEPLGTGHTGITETSPDIATPKPPHPTAQADATLLCEPLRHMTPADSDWASRSRACGYVHSKRHSWLLWVPLHHMYNRPWGCAQSFREAGPRSLVESGGHVCH